MHVVGTEIGDVSVICDSVNGNDLRWMGGIRINHVMVSPALKLPVNYEVSLGSFNSSELRFVPDGPGTYPVSPLVVIYKM